jgi:hypothetical protein
MGISQAFPLDWDGSPHLGYLKIKGQCIYEIGSNVK